MDELRGPSPHVCRSKVRSLWWGTKSRLGQADSSLSSRATQKARNYWSLVGVCTTREEPTTRWRSSSVMSAIAFDKHAEVPVYPTFLDVVSARCRASG